MTLTKVLRPQPVLFFRPIAQADWGGTVSISAHHPTSSPRCHSVSHVGVCSFPCASPICFPDHFKLVSSHLLSMCPLRNAGVSLRQRLCLWGMNAWVLNLWKQWHRMWTPICLFWFEDSELVLDLYTSLCENLAHQCVVSRLCLPFTGLFSCWRHRHLLVPPAPPKPGGFPKSSTDSFPQLMESSVKTSVLSLSGIQALATGWLPAFCYSAVVVSVLFSFTSWR